MDMKSNISILTIALVILATASTAAAQANLKPGFNVKNGKVTVKNVGNSGSGRSVATVRCTTSAPTGCPDPAPALVAAYENPAYPNVASIKIPPLKQNTSTSHTLAFFGGLVWSPGTYFLTVCVDAGDHVAESNEGDNCRRFRKKVRGPIAGLVNLRAP